jgi:hypothetical protein
MITKILKEQTPKSDRLKSCSYDLAVISKDARGMQLKNESWRWRARQQGSWCLAGAWVGASACDDGSTVAPSHQQVFLL